MCLVPWNTFAFKVLTYNLRSTTPLRLPCYEEAQATLRSVVLCLTILEERSFQVIPFRVLNTHIKKLSEDSNSSHTSYPLAAESSQLSLHTLWTTDKPFPMCPAWITNCHIHEYNKIFVLYHQILGWFVTQQWTTETSS